MYRVIESLIDITYGNLYGGVFSFLDSQKPDSIMLAEGSEIVVRSMNKIV